MEHREKIEYLYKKYLNSFVTKRCSGKELQDLFIKRYDAKIIDVKKMALFLDTVEMDSFSVCMIIDNLDVLNQIFTDEEKQGFEDLKQYNQEFFVVHTKSEMEYTRIQEGEYILVFLKISHDEQVESFKLVGNSSKVCDELIVGVGIEQDKCHLENPMFQDYLYALSNLGYLN